MRSNNCIACSKTIPEKQAKNYCDFCGSRACDKCMHKMRGFKSHLEDQENPQEKIECDDGDQTLKTMLPSLTAVSGSKSATSNSMIQAQSMKTRQSQMVSPIGKPSKGGECSPGDAKMGKVCKICDRKFFMWSTYNMYQQQMEN